MSDNADGGDPVCWLAGLCPECGAMPTDDPTGNTCCWRCGADLPPRDRDV